MTKDRFATYKWLFFWIGFWLLQSLLMSGGEVVWFYLIKNIAIVGLQMAVVYVNLKVLFPRFFQKAKYASYVIAGVVLIYLVFSLSFVFIDLLFFAFLDFENSALTDFILVTDFWAILSGSSLYSLALVCSTLYQLLRITKRATGTEEVVSTEAILLKEGHKTHIIKPSDVHYIQGLKEYVIWNTNSGKIVVLQSLAHIENQYATHGFLRVHKSYIINARNVNSVESRNIHIGSIEIPIGRKYKDNVLAYFGEAE